MMVTLWFWFASLALAIEQTFVNRKLEQDIDLSAAYARATVNVRARNIGSEPAAHYYVPIRTEDWDNLAVVEAQSRSGMALPVVKTDIVENGLHYVEVELLQPVPPGEDVHFAYAVAYTDRINPLPFKTAQNRPQYLVYDGSRTILSAYDSEQQISNIRVSTNRITDLETKKEVPLSQGSAVLENEKDVSAGKWTPMRLQYQCQTAQIHVKDLRRQIWVSHWSDAVSIDESYDITNRGARLDKPFSRLTYLQSNSMPQIPTLSQAAVNVLELHPGPDARDAYYVDLVGNVSTSRPRGDGTLHVQTRYPVMGGWNYNFTVGWTVPLGRYVNALKQSTYAVTLPVIDGPDGVAYDSVENTVILPEGAKNVRVVAEENASPSYGTVFSYLDIRGRPSVTLKYENLVGEHRAHTFSIVYEYTLLDALVKPLSYSLGFFVMFVVAYLWSFVDLSLVKNAIRSHGAEKNQISI